MDWATALTVLGTLAAVAVGSVLSHRSEHSKWLRERRFEAYTEAVQTLRYLIRTAPTADETVSDRTQLLSAAMSKATFVSNYTLGKRLDGVFANGVLAGLPEGVDLRDPNYHAFNADATEVEFLLRQELGFLEKKVSVPSRPLLRNLDN